MGALQHSTPRASCCACAMRWRRATASRSARIHPTLITLTRNSAASRSSPPCESADTTRGLCTKRDPEPPPPP
eukprot:3023851-Prymnesium_polylepis.1